MGITLICAFPSKHSRILPRTPLLPRPIVTERLGFIILAWCSAVTCVNSNSYLSNLARGQCFEFAFTEFLNPTLRRRVVSSGSSPWDSSVNIVTVTTTTLCHRQVGVRIPAIRMDFAFFETVQNSLLSHGYRERAGNPEAEQTLPPASEVKYERSYTVSPHTSSLRIMTTLLHHVL